MVSLRQSRVMPVGTTVGATSWQTSFNQQPLQGSLLLAVAGFQQDSTGSRNITVGSAAGYTLKVTGKRNWIGLAASIKRAGASETSTVVATMTTGVTDYQGLLLAEFTGNFDPDVASTAVPHDRSTVFTSTSRAISSMDVGHGLYIPLVVYSGDGHPSSIVGTFSLLDPTSTATTAWHRIARAAWSERESGPVTATWNTGGSASIVVGGIAVPLSEPDLPPEEGVNILRRRGSGWSAPGSTVLRRRSGSWTS